MEHLMIHEIREMGPERLIELLEQKRVSVLEAYGKLGLHRSLLPVRWLVGLALRIIFRGMKEDRIEGHFYYDSKINPKARKRAVKLLKRFTPFEAYDLRPQAVKEIYGDFERFGLGFIDEKNREYLKDRDLDADGVKYLMATSLAKKAYVEYYPDSVPVSAEVVQKTIEVEHGILVGFNHPSLGEIPRMLALCLDMFPDKELVFPVTLPWFEMFAPYWRYFDGLGIRLTPIVTPHAMETLLQKRKKREGVSWVAFDKTEGPNAGMSDEWKAETETLNHLRLTFQARYMQLATETMKRRGIVLLAPSAQRQATVFPDRETFFRSKPTSPVMTMLIRKFFAGKVENFTILPLAVEPPELHTKMINLFRKYRLYIPGVFKARELKNTQLLAHDFDYFFLKEIADVPEVRDLAYPGCKEYREKCEEKHGRHRSVKR